MTSREHQGTREILEMELRTFKTSCLCKNFFSSSSIYQPTTARNLLDLCGLVWIFTHLKNFFFPYKMGSSFSTTNLGILFLCHLDSVCIFKVCSSVMLISVQSLSRVRLFATPWTAARQASLSITSSQSLLRTHVHQVSDTIQPSHPLLSPSPSVFNLSQH